MNIKQFSATTGLSAYTLRYYEKIGLLLGIKRNASGHRFYSESDVAWVEFLKKLKETGMSLSEIKSFAKLRNKGDLDFKGRLKILEKHQKKLQSDFAVLQDFLEKIRYKIKYYKSRKK